jgi:hypothetical protein
MEIDLKPVAIAAAIVGTALLIGTTMGQEQAQADRDEYRYKLEQAESRPFPTVTVVKPGPTVTVTPKPKPAKTIYIERSSDRASRSSRPSSAKSTVNRAKADSSFSGNATLACIRKHESGNDYQDVSDSGTYRGAYQMSRQYSPGWAKRAGYGEWAGKTADKWPPAVQDAVAWNMSNQGRWWGHWDDHTSYNCPGF